MKLYNAFTESCAYWTVACGTFYFVYIYLLAWLNLQDTIHPYQMTIDQFAWISVIIIGSKTVYKYFHSSLYKRLKL